MTLVDISTIDSQPRRSRSRPVVALTIAGVAAFVAAVLIVRNDPALGQLRIREQSVSVDVQGTGSAPGEEGQGLDARDVIRTDETGEAQIDFFDGSLVRMDHATTLAVRELARVEGGRRIELELEQGRTWNRVEHSTSPRDRFEVRGPNAVARVHGTTFVADGRQAPIWYYLGQDGSTEVDPPSGEPFMLSAGRCVRVDPDGLRPCTDHEREALLDDWVRVNQALDEADIERVDATTRPPTGTPAIGRTSGSGDSAPGRTSTPAHSRRPSLTDHPNEAEEATDDPRPARPEVPNFSDDSTQDEPDEPDVEDTPEPDEPEEEPEAP